MVTSKTYKKDPLMPYYQAKIELWSRVAAQVHCCCVRMSSTPRTTVAAGVG